MHRTMAVLPALWMLLMLCATSPVAGQGRVVEDFALQNTDGSMVSTKDYKDAKGFMVVFTCLHCPFAKLYHNRLLALQARYAPQRVPLLLINASDTIMFADENLKNMARLAREKKYTFPYLFDPSQQVARSFAAEKTPHAFVIWKESKGWRVHYSGAIDDNGAHPELVKQPYVANAVEELLAGKPVSVPQGHSIGCAIHYRNKN